MHDVQQITYRNPNPEHSTLTRSSSGSAGRGGDLSSARHAPNSGEFRRQGLGVQDLGFRV